ncbi:MAG: hypothetical protein IPJ34_35620 [Myxococcales bacterium]|nr:hypothetical protein [Myxococcales bacterium]
MNQRLRHLLERPDDAEGPYEDAVRAKLGRKAGLTTAPEKQLAAIEREIVQEMAGALGRAEKKVEDALAACQALAPSVHDERTLAAYGAAREHYLRMRWELRVHRDALGFGLDPRFEQRWPQLPRDPRA